MLESGIDPAKVHLSLRALVDRFTDLAANAQAFMGSLQRSIDLHDCFLGAVAGRRGTSVLSFDADLRKLGVSEKP